MWLHHFGLLQTMNDRGSLSHHNLALTFLKILGHSNRSVAGPHCFNLHILNGMIWSITIYAFWPCVYFLWQGYLLGLWHIL